jgi:hypothetical protein
MPAIPASARLRSCEVADPIVEAHAARGWPSAASGDRLAAMTEHALDQLEVQPSNLLAERAAYVEAVIRHRCPELTDADLASAESKVEPEVVMIPPELAKHILAALDGINERLAQLEHRLDARRLLH